MTMYKAINQEGERRLFYHLTEACEFAGKSYHSVYRAFKLGKAVDGIEEVLSLIHISEPTRPY